MAFNVLKENEFPFFENWSFFYKNYCLSAFEPIYFLRLKNGYCIVFRDTELIVKILILQYLAKFHKNLQLISFFKKIFWSFLS